MRPLFSEAQERVDDAKSKLNQARNAQDLLQEGGFLFAESMQLAKAMVTARGLPNMDTYTDFLLIVAGPFLRGQCCWIQDRWQAESTRLMLDFDAQFNEPKGFTYVSQGTGWGRITHELSHFFAGGDIYAESYADGSFLEGSAGPYAMMGTAGDNPALYIGYNIEKRLDYFAEGANGNIKYLEWGSVPRLNETYELVAHAKTQNPVGDQVFHLLRIKVTEGLYYNVEVRQRPDASAGAAATYQFDNMIPLMPAGAADRAGVIAYKVVENNNQSNNLGAQHAIDAAPADASSW